jgi:hypothetical protein
MISCLIFRYRDSIYNSFEIIGERRTLTLLRKKSCKGCEKCGWFWECIQEDIANECIPNLDGLENGKMYCPVFVEGSRDWESGELNDWEWDWKEYKENEGD